MARFLLIFLAVIYLAYMIYRISQGYRPSLIDMAAILLSSAMAGSLIYYLITSN